MKKNSLWVGLCQVKGQKNIIFSKNVQKSKEHRFGWVQRSKKLGGTLRSSSAILGEYPWVLKCYTRGVPLGPEVLYLGCTDRLSALIFLPVARSLEKNKIRSIVCVKVKSQSLCTWLDEVWWECYEKK